MQTTKFKDKPTKGPLLRSQIVLYAISTLLSVLFLGFYTKALIQEHREHPTAAPAPVDPNSFRGGLAQVFQTWKRDVWENHPGAQPTQAAPRTAATSAPVAPVATPVPVANPAAASPESLDSEVSRVVPTLVHWTPAALDPAKMADYGSEQMGALEGWKSSTFSRDVTDWQTMPDVPTLAGHYLVTAAAPSDWPVRGSIAVEIVPTEGDPTGQGGPWRVVLFLASPTKADEAILYRSFLGTAPANAREIVLGKNAVPAVPVACESIKAGGRTFYCVAPVESVVRVRLASVDVEQRIKPQAPQVAQVQPTPAPAAPATPAADPVAARHAAWQVTHDAYVQQVRTRIAAAHSDAEKGQIKQDIERWQRMNPEPPKSATTPTGDEIPIK